MFTGIIEDRGTVKSVEIRGASGKIIVKTSLDARGINPGDSIAVEGVCLTVTDIADGAFTADLSPETLDTTTLGGLRSGARVNLERALTLQKPLGGHLVTGHIDGVGHIKRKTPGGGGLGGGLRGGGMGATGGRGGRGGRDGGDFLDIEFSVPSRLLTQIVMKGSVAVDGISLTVKGIARDGFSCAVIPHTLALTTLGEKAALSKVNIETDIIAKYVERLVSGREESGVTEGFLSEHGFLDVDK